MSTNKVGHLDMVLVLTTFCSTGFSLCYLNVLYCRERGFNCYITNGQWYSFKMAKLPNHGLPHLGRVTKHSKCSSKQAIHYISAGKCNANKE